MEETKETSKDIVGRCAMIRHLEGLNNINKHSSLTYEESYYPYALFDDSINVGDLVLCISPLGCKIGKIINIQGLFDKYMENEVICKIDFKDYLQRQIARERKAELKSQISNRIKSFGEMATFQLFAEKNPDIAKLLSEYQSIPY